MQSNTSTFCRQYGMKKAQIRRQLTRPRIRGFSGLNMLDHIKWTGGPPIMGLLL
jgi:hypothetical protein